MNTGSVYLCNKECKLCENTIWFVCDDMKNINEEVSENLEHFVMTLMTIEKC